MKYVTDATKEYIKKHRLAKDDAQQDIEKLKEILRKAFKDKYEALRKISKIVSVFYNKWPEEKCERILNQFKIDGPGALDALSPDLLSEVEEYDPDYAPSDDEIEDDVDTFIDDYVN